MHQFIKANGKVAAFLGLATQRSQFPDGNFLLWKLDLIPLGGNSDDTLRMIGGVGMTSIEARKEQKGESCIPLPMAEDVRFRIEVPSSEESDVQTESQGTVSEGISEELNNNEEDVEDE